MTIIESRNYQGEPLCQKIKQTITSMHTGFIEEDAKKAIQKSYVKPKLYWELDE